MATTEKLFNDIIGYVKKYPHFKNPDGSFNFTLTRIDTGTETYERIVQVRNDKTGEDELFLKSFRNGVETSSRQVSQDDTALLNYIGFSIRRLLVQQLLVEITNKSEIFEIPFSDGSKISLSFDNSGHFKKINTLIYTDKNGEQEDYGKDSLNPFAISKELMEKLIDKHLSQMKSMYLEGLQLFSQKELLLSKRVQYETLQSGEGFNPHFFVASAFEAGLHMSNNNILCDTSINRKTIEYRFGSQDKIYRISVSKESPFAVSEAFVDFKKDAEAHFTVMDKATGEKVIKPVSKMDLEEKLTAALLIVQDLVNNNHIDKDIAEKIRIGWINEYFVGKDNEIRSLEERRPVDRKALREAIEKAVSETEDLLVKPGFITSQVLDSKKEQWASKLARLENRDILSLLKGVGNPAIKPLLEDIFLNNYSPYTAIKPQLLSDKAGSNIIQLYYDAARKDYLVPIYLSAERCKELGLQKKESNFTIIRVDRFGLVVDDNTTVPITFEQFMKMSRERNPGQGFSVKIEYKNTRVYNIAETDFNDRYPETYQKLVDMAIENSQTPAQLKGDEEKNRQTLEKAIRTGMGIWNLRPECRNIVSLMTEKFFNVKYGYDLNIFSSDANVLKDAKDSISQKKICSDELCRAFNAASFAADKLARTHFLRDDVYIDVRKMINENKESLQRGR